MITMSTYHSVSIVIPAYNEEGKIGEALRSMTEGQTVSPDEVIVVDNQSTDETRQIAGRYADQVLTAPRKLSVGGVRNVGIEEANSEIIYNTDADVVFSPDVIKSTKEAFEENPDLKALSHKIKAKTSDGYVEQFITNLGSLKESKGWGASTAFKKSVWRDIGGFNNIGGEHIPEMEDRDLWNRLPDPKVLDTTASVQVELSEFKSGFLPVTAASATATGVGLYKYEEDYGKLLTGGGIGAFLSELGHQFIDNDRTDTSYMLFHHDILGLMGLAATYGYDRYKENGIDNEYALPTYGFFSGMVTQHLLTEGFTPLFHKDRRSMFDRNERK